MIRAGAVAVVLAVMATACGGSRGPVPDVGGAPGSDPDQPVSSSPLAPGDAGGDPSPQQVEVVEPRPGMTNVNPTAIDDVEVGDDGRTLRVTFYSGVAPCYVLDSVDVEEGPEQVTITLYQGSDPAQPDAVCIDIAKLEAVDVTLDEPLGDREIVDGAH